MSLADRTFAAVLFDNDGTLVDSTGSVTRSWVTWAQEHDIDPRTLVGHHGMPAPAIIASVAPHLDPQQAFARIEQQPRSTTSRTSSPCPACSTPSRRSATHPPRSSPRPRMSWPGSGWRQRASASRRS
ncbi:hypothetical protein [Janibacter indicus]|uniref:hypothetical protein n=1 Tax=Janibacter indicus TaxID=857417 RepID=UPI003D9A412A